MGKFEAPMKPGTREAYGKRIERVVAYLTAHLDDALDLNRLADEASFSPYHFHRIYHSMVGETIADTVRRLRLHRAAVALITTKAPLPALARDAGYGSVQAFTRAFRVAYGVPPAAYRADLPMSQPIQRQEDSMYRIAIREFKPLRVAALRHTGDYQAIGSAFERLYAWAAGQGLLGADTPAPRSLGVYYDDHTARPAAELTSDACMTVPIGTKASGDIRIIDLPPSRCAVLLHVGPYAELGHAYRWLFGQWLPASGEEPADLPCMEEYLNDPRSCPPAELRTEVYAPLRG